MVDTLRLYSKVIEGAMNEITKIGPRRVIINEEGEATSRERAFRFQGKNVDIVFIRHDGWNLGAISELADAAEALWENNWVAVLVMPSDRAISYSDYRRLKSEGFGVGQNKKKD